MSIQQLWQWKEREVKSEIRGVGEIRYIGTVVDIPNCLTLLAINEKTKSLSYDTFLKFLRCQLAKCEGKYLYHNLKNGIHFYQEWLKTMLGNWPGQSW